MLSLSIYRKHTRARRNQPCTNQQRNYVPTRARQRKQADRVGEREHVVEHLHSSLRFQNERRNRNLPGKNMQPLTRQQLKLMWRAKNSPLFPISRKYKTSFSLRHFYLFLTCMRLPGCFHGAWSSANPAGPVLSLEVSVVATISLTFNAFRFWFEFRKSVFRFFLHFFVLNLSL